MSNLTSRSPFRSGFAGKRCEIGLRVRRQQSTCIGSWHSIAPIAQIVSWHIARSNGAIGIAIRFHPLSKPYIRSISTCRILKTLLVTVSKSTDKDRNIQRSNRICSSTLYRVKLENGLFQDLTFPRPTNLQSAVARKRLEMVDRCQEGNRCTDWRLGKGLDSVHCCQRLSSICTSLQFIKGLTDRVKTGS